MSTTEIEYSPKVTSPLNSHCKRITTAWHILYDNWMQSLRDMPCIIQGLIARESVFLCLPRYMKMCAGDILVLWVVAMKQYLLWQIMNHYGLPSIWYVWKKLSTYCPFCLEVWLNQFIVGYFSRYMILLSGDRGYGVGS